MNTVVEHGTPLVDDPDRVGPVVQLGVDETSFLAANRAHSTIYATGLVDLERRVVIDMVRGNRAADLRRWTTNADPEWLARIEVVATDLAESFRAGLSPHLDHTTRVADPFHVVRVANRCLDKVRRRVQNETLGHRGRKHDPLYRIRKLLLAGSERLDEHGQDRLLLGLRVGDPHDEVLGAWLAKESVREVYLTDDPDEAALLLDKAIVACTNDQVAEIQSLGRTLRAWRAEILAHHQTGASNGPTEGLNLCVKKVKRCGHGFRSFEHYRLRVLLHAGGVTWPNRPSPPRIRTRPQTRSPLGRRRAPLPAELGAIRRVRAGSFTSVGCLVQRAVQRDVAEIETDDPIERRECFSDEIVEHAGVDPLVAPGPQRRVRHCKVEDRFDIDPRRAGHQTDQDPSETELVQTRCR